MLVLRTMVFRPTGAALRTSVTLRNAPGLPPATDCAAVLLPPLPAVNWVNAQLASRKVLSDADCATAGPAAIVATTDISKKSHADLAFVRCVERFIIFPLISASASSRPRRFESRGRTVDSGE